MITPYPHLTGKRSFPEVWKNLQMDANPNPLEKAYPNEVKNLIS